MLALIRGIDQSSAPRWVDVAPNVDAHCAAQVFCSSTSDVSAQAAAKMAMSALPLSPSGADGGSGEHHPTLALLESLLLDSDSEESDDSLNDQAIEKFANEIELAEIDDASAAAPASAKPSTSVGTQPESKSNRRRRTTQRRQRKCTYAARREEADRLRREAWSLHQQYKLLLSHKAQREQQESALAAAQLTNRELRDQLALVETEIAELFAAVSAYNTADMP